MVEEMNMGEWMMMKKVYGDGLVNWRWNGEEF